MLKGAKTTLRAFTKADMPVLLRHSQDVEVGLLAGGDPPRPATLEGWEKWFEEHLAKDAKDSAHFAIEAEGKLIGMCGLWEFNAHTQTCELGVAIGDKEYWGRGYGREVVGVLVAYAFRTRNFRKVCLNTSGTNGRAIACYRACGFVEEGRLRQQLWVDGQYVDEVHMGILRDEWERAQSHS